MGPTQEILVLADPEEWVQLEPVVRDIFEKVLRTPQVEKIFSIQLGRMADIEALKHLERKNLMVLSTIDAATETGEFLRSLLSDDVVASIRQGQSGITWKRDVWASEQLLIVASGSDVENLIGNLDAHTVQRFPGAGIEHTAFYYAVFRLRRRRDDPDTA